MMEKLEKIISEKQEYFHKGQMNCAETVLSVMAEYYNWDYANIPRIATAFGGGLCGMQSICGAITGGLMVIGILKGRECGGDKQPAYTAGRELIEWLNQRIENGLCRSIIEIDLSVPGNQEVFRQPGGKHETVCEPLVASVCKHLAELYPLDGI